MIHRVKSGNTIQSAIDQANPGDIIQIEEGCYQEKIEIRTSGLILIGKSNEECIITYGDYARKQHTDGREYGTFRSYTCLVLADDITFCNLTIENSAGDGREVGQAIALFAQGDRLQVRNCRLIGHQDTLFAGPLPPEPRIPGSFVGPTEGMPYRRSRQYYYNCSITGDIDFIFGSALAVFNHCELIVRDRGEKINGFVSAPSTWEGEPYGFVFINSHFMGQEGIQPQTAFLARPWRPYGQVTLIRCSYDQSFHQDRWDYWGDEANKETVRFKEFGSYSIRFLELWHLKMLGSSENIN